MQNDIDNLIFFQILDRKQIKNEKAEGNKKKLHQIFDMVSIQEHGWSRTEIAIIKNIANAYRDDKKVEIAISILRKAIESFDKETIGQENACLGKQLLWETLATYLGDVEKYEEAILYAKREWKKIFEMVARRESAVRYMRLLGMREKEKQSLKYIKRNIFRLSNLRFYFKKENILYFWNNERNNIDVKMVVIYYYH